MYIDILIDASGSMGFMKGAGVEHENKYLIDSNHTRTDLVKKILTNHIIPNIDYCTSIQIDTFSNLKKVDNNGNPIIVDQKYVEYPKNINYYKGDFNENLLIEKINSIPNPKPSGTPLRWCLLNKIYNISSSKSNLILITDGDGYLDSKIDQDWHIAVYKKVIESKKDIKIHIIGIAQNDVAKGKSKSLCANTKGVYTNLDSINYDSSKLNELLFSLKSNITSQVINEHISSSLKVPNESKDSIVNNDLTEIVQKEFKDSNNDNLEERVKKNTKSLSLISNQLDNIIKLLQSKETIKEDEIVDVIENEANNSRVGHKAEKYLYAELLKNNWDEVVWINKETEQYLPYDFKIINKSEVFYYECKGTANDSNEFFITKNEWLFYLANRKNYRLCFVSNVDLQPTYVRFMDLLNAMEESKLIPCSSVNKRIKADRIIFQVL